jgi:iron complex outermembrane recepter protein
MSYGGRAQWQRAAARSQSLFASGITFGALLPAVTLAEAPLAPSLYEPDIIVTARKIEENPQDIPMSVQVISGEYLDAADLTRLYELQFNIPGLVLNNVGLWGAGFALRGVSDQSGTGPSVAAHLNGVHQGTANLAITRLFDFERIEVLKGPQGTLYGRNATGGSINFITRAPEDTFSAAVEGAYASFSTTRVQGHVNLPLGNAAARLAVIVSDGDGYIKNSVDNRKFAESDFCGARASFRADAGDALRIDVMAQRVKDDGASGELWTPHPDFLPNPDDIRVTTVTLSNPYLITENDSANITLEYDLPFATLRSISGYARNETRNLDDCAGIPLLTNCVRGARPISYRQWSQELQLHFRGSGTLDGVAGIYYFHARDTRDYHEFLPGVDPAPLTNSHSTVRERSAAAFGQATLQLSDRWSLTGGLRLSEDDRRITTIGTGVRDSPTLVAAGNESSHVSWRLDLKHASSDRLLWYAGVSTGYKSGGYTRTLVNGEPDDYGPEELTAYETGVKSQWLSRRLTLNAAAFYYDFEDLQVATIALSGSRPGFNVANAAKAELIGIDAEGAFQVSDRVSVSGGGVWIPRRKFVRFLDDEIGESISGNKLILAPEWTATAAINYLHPVQNFGRVTGRLEYSYRSRYFFTKENDPQFAQPGFGLLNLYLRLEPANERWYLFASGRNLTNEDYFHQVFFQSSPGYPDNYEIGFGYRF